MLPSKIRKTSLLCILVMTTTATNKNKVASLIFPQAQHFVAKEDCQTEFGIVHPPVITVNTGEFLHVETNDCFHGQIHPGLNDPVQVLNQMGRDEFNPVTGPIYIRDAMPGDMLAVTLVDIQPQGVGVACCGPHAGQLRHWMKPDETTTKFFDLSQSNKEESKLMVTMRDVLTSSSTSSSSSRRKQKIAPISFPASPMLGVLGVAPAGSASISTMPAGQHGGNLDNNANGIGSTIYLPVNHPGALLSMGDMHASQGDGEISGNGVEIGGHVLLQCHVIKREDLYGSAEEERRLTLRDANDTIGTAAVPLTLDYPVTETPTHWITHGVVEQDIPQTTVVACEQAAKLLVGQWGLSPEEAFVLLSVQGNLGLCQSCHPDQGTQIAKMSVPKLQVCPRPFRVLWKKKEQKEKAKKDST